MTDPADKREPCKVCREYVDLKLLVIEEKFKAIESAKILEQRQLNEHLKNLNHEGRRIADMTLKTVSADTWNGFTKQYEERHGFLEKKVNDAATKKDLDALQTNMTLKQGQSQGISWVGSVTIAMITAVAAIVSMIAVFSHIYVK
jgi:hypothetical protein